MNFYYNWLQTREEEKNTTDWMGFSIETKHWNCINCENENSTES